eukprot:5599206-Amphidinium_carterae.1
MASDGQGSKGPPPPTWNGEPGSWRRFKQELRLWKLATPTPAGWSPAARIIYGLTGPVRRVGMQLSEAQLRGSADDPWASVAHLEHALETLCPRRIYVAHISKKGSLVVLWGNVAMEKRCSHIMSLSCLLCNN